MFLSHFFGRQNVRSTRRPLAGRRPLVEALEGRQLLSTLTVTNVTQNHVVGSHIGTNAIVGQHIGMENIVGQHIGTNAMDAAGVVARKH